MASVRLQIMTGEDRPDVLDLPWDAPLEKWSSDRVVDVVHGISRHHVVRFVRHEASIDALEEIDFSPPHRALLRGSGVPNLREHLSTCSRSSSCASTWPASSGATARSRTCSSAGTPAPCRPTWSTPRSSPAAGSRRPTSDPRSDPGRLRGRLEPAEVYHQVLEHRRFLSEELGRCATMDEAIASYAERVLRSAPDERVVDDADPVDIHGGASPPVRTITP